MHNSEPKRRKKNICKGILHLDDCKGKINLWTLDVADPELRADIIKHQVRSQD